MTEPDKNTSPLGAAAAASAFLMWGLLPIYWKQLSAVEYRELMAHRIVWTVAFAALLVTLTRRWPEVLGVFRSKLDIARAMATAALIGVNWVLFLWAVNHEHLFECSLGYFINPLVSVLLGAVFLRERMRRRQVVAVGFGGAGVAVLLIYFGQFPWIALTLACSFGLYGLLRKTARIEAVPGLLVETSILGVPALVYIAIQPAGPLGVFAPLDATGSSLLVASGVATSLPLLCFAYGARRIALSTVGFLQYIGPTCMFVIAWLIYPEDLTWAKLVAFPLIWVGLAIYSVDAIRNRPATRPMAKPVDS